MWNLCWWNVTVVIQLISCTSGLQVVRCVFVQRCRQLSLNCPSSEVILVSVETVGQSVDNSSHSLYPGISYLGTQVPELLFIVQMSTDINRNFHYTDIHLLFGYPGANMLVYSTSSYDVDQACGFVSVHCSLTSHVKRLSAKINGRWSVNH